MTDRLMVLDTASLYFRAFYGVPTSITAADGTPVNAVRGLLDFIARLVSDHRPSQLVAAWDNDWRPQFRVDLVPSYKTHRLEAEQPEAGIAEQVPDELSPQVPVIEEFLALLGICRVGADGYEADDVIGTLATRADGPVAIVTGDRDLFQLVDDLQPVKVLYTAAKGVGAAEVIDNAAVRARYGVNAAQYADFALLRGDASDGLPGVRGVGEKTATRLIRDFGSVDALVTALQEGTDGLSPSLRARLTAGLPYLAAAGPVVRVVRDLPLPEVDAAIPEHCPDPAALAAAAHRWGVTSSVERVSRSFGWSP